MYYDLNIPWPVRIGSGGASGSGSSTTSTSKKQHQKANKQAINDGRNTAANSSSSSSSKVGADLITSEDRFELEKKVKMAIKLGYSTIAFNVTLPSNAFDASTIGTYNPCYGHKPPFPELDTRTADTSKGQKTLLQLSRLTVVLDEKSISGGKGNGMLFTATNANSIAGYNILAALPLDSTSFSQVCLSLSSASPTGIDIITLDLASSPRLPFQLKRSLVLKAISEGTMFEICYAPAMRLNNINDNSNLPKEARRNIIAGARELIRITNGKGIILSSEVKRALEMRSPLDLCNLGTILGFKPDQSKMSVSGNARLAVIRGHAARQTYRGVLTNPEIVESVVVGTSQEGKDETKSTSAATQDATENAATTATSTTTTTPAEESTTVAPTAPSSAGKRKRGADDEIQKRKKKL